MYTGILYIFIMMMLTQGLAGMTESTNSTTAISVTTFDPGKPNDQTEDDDYQMNLGTQVLMIIYIGAAVILSVVPFGIYFYITCKKLGFITYCKRKFGNCKNAPPNYGDVTARPWPYQQRPVDYSDETGEIFMINLPSYDDVLRNAQLYKMASDIKVFYSVINKQTDRRTQTSSEHQDVLVQTDNTENHSSEIRGQLTNEQEYLEQSSAITSEQPPILDFNQITSSPMEQASSNSTPEQSVSRYSEQSSSAEISEHLSEVDELPQYSVSNGGSRTQKSWSEIEQSQIVAASVLPRAASEVETSVQQITSSLTKNKSEELSSEQSTKNC